MIPASLREKNTSSKVSREIFFIDCCNDLRKLAQSSSTYDLIRASIILRMLIVDGTLEKFALEHDEIIILNATSEIIYGKGFSNSEMRNIKKIIGNLANTSKTTNYLELTHEPENKYSLREFQEIVCLKFQTEQEFCFTVKNIIQNVSNKHGAAHLEHEFDSSTMDEFMLHKFSPFSTQKNSFFLKIIKETAIILSYSMLPLCIKIAENLKDYNSRVTQSEGESFAYISTFEKE